MNNMVIEMPAAKTVRLLIVVILHHTSTYMFVQGRELVIKYGIHPSRLLILKLPGMMMENLITTLSIFLHMASYGEG